MKIVTIDEYFHLLENEKIFQNGLKHFFMIEKEVTE
jgi:hypothetical protein